jgi:hypothetical protein
VVVPLKLAQVVPLFLRSHLRLLSVMFYVNYNIILNIAKVNKKTRLS